MIRKFNDFIVKEEMARFTYEDNEYKSLVTLFKLRDILNDITADGWMYHYTSSYINKIEKIFNEVEKNLEKGIKQFAKDNNLNESDFFRNLNNDTIKEVKKYYEKEMTRNR